MSLTFCQRLGLIVVYLPSLANAANVYFVPQKTTRVFAAATRAPFSNRVPPWRGRCPSPPPSLRLIIHQRISVRRCVPAVDRRRLILQALRATPTNRLPVQLPSVSPQAGRRW